MYDDRDCARLERGRLIGNQRVIRRGLHAPTMRDSRLGWNTTTGACIMPLARSANKTATSLADLL